MELKEIINRHAVSVDVEIQDKEEAFDYISKMLLEDGSINSIETFKRDLYAREAEGQTGIGNGIAIPHGKSKAVEHTCISIIKLKQPMEWETLDNNPVSVIILFAVSIEDKNTYFLKLMAQVARKLAQEGICQKLKECETEEELITVLS